LALENVATAKPILVVRTGVKSTLTKPRTPELPKSFDFNPFHQTPVSWLKWRMYLNNYVKQLWNLSCGRNWGAKTKHWGNRAMK
jgi:hypothetical protein